jgi:hypothetical protein
LPIDMALQQALVQSFLKSLFSKNLKKSHNHVRRNY